MEDLGEPNEPFNPEFRFVEGPRFPLEETPGLASKQSVPSNSRHVSVSSRYGYAFVAAKNSVSVFRLSLLRDTSNEIATPVATIILNSDEYILAIDLIMKDRCLLLHVRNCPEALSEILFALDVPKLIDGTCARLSWLGNHPCATFTSFDDQTTPKVALVTPEKSVKMLELPIGPPRELWNKSTGSLDSQAPLSLAFSHDGSNLAVGTRRGSVQLFNVLNGSLRATVREVESGWIPVSVAFIGKDQLLVCYQNHDRLNHVVWNVTDGNVTVQSVLGDVFYPDIGAGEREVYTYCTPIDGWNVCILANSSSEDVKAVALSDEGWVVWTLEDGHEVALIVDGNPVFPTGFAIDYTDVRQVPLSGKGPRNPMPRFIALTSDGSIWSSLISNDKDGVTCQSIKEPCSISEAEPFSLPSTVDTARDTSTGAVNRDELEFAEPKSVSTPTDSVTDEVDATAQPSTSSLFGDNVRGGTLFSSMNTNSLFSKSSTAFTGLVFPGSTNSQSSFASPFSTLQTEAIVREDPPVTFKDSDQGNSFKNEFLFKESSTGATESENEIPPPPDDDEIPSSDDEIQDETENEASVPVEYEQKSEIPIVPPRDLVVTAPDMSEPYALAKHDDPEYQLQSILSGMEREIAYVRAQNASTLKAVGQSQGHLNENLKILQSVMSTLLERDSEYWVRERQIRAELDAQLRAVIENGQNFEDLNLLNTLLSENDDARPLPSDIQEMDRRLNTVEDRIRDRLNEVERKIEESLPEISKTRSSTQWTSQAEVTQHIYSSLSLQGVRIKRVRALLDTLCSQVQSSMEEEEIRVANSGLSRSRLERLAQITTSPGHSVATPSSTRPVLGTPFSSRVPIGTPMNNSGAKPPPMSGRRSSMDSLQRSMQRTSIRNSSSVNQGFSRFDLEKEEAESAILRQESATMLRRLAMRRGRERITVSEKTPSNNMKFRKSKSSPVVATVQLVETRQEETVAPVPEPKKTPVLSRRKAPEHVSPPVSKKSQVVFKNETPEYAALPLPKELPAAFEKEVPEFAPPPVPKKLQVVCKEETPEYAAPPIPKKSHVLFKKEMPEYAALPLPKESPVTSQAPKIAVDQPNAAVEKEESEAPVEEETHVELANIEGASTSEVEEEKHVEEVAQEVESPEECELDISNLGSTLPLGLRSSGERITEPETEANVTVSTFSNQRQVEDSSSSEDEGISSQSVTEPSSSASMFSNGSKPLVFGSSTSGSLFGHTFGSTSSSFSFGGSTVAGLFGQSTSAVPISSSAGSSAESTSMNPTTSSSSLFSQSTSSTSAFGQSSSASTTASSVGFQMTAAASGFGFGMSSQGGTKPSGFGGFGNSLSNTQSSNTSGFSFSGASSSFGQHSTFGNTATNSAGFGISTGSGFGTQPTATFGAPSSLGASSAPTFGAPSTLGAGAPPAFGTPSALGANAPAFGAPSAIGANANPSGFGAMQSSAPLFGGSSNSGGGFGSVTSQGTPQSKGSPFAQLSNNSSGFGSGFGGGGSGFSGQKLFGTPNNQSGFAGGFGSSGGGVSGFGQVGGGSGNGGFGQAASASGFGQMANGGGGFGSFGQSQSQTNQFNSDAFRKRRS